MSRRRPFRARPLAAAALAALVLAGCGTARTATTASAAKSAGPVVVQLWESHSGGPVATTMSALVSRFNSSHRSVQVQLKVTKASTKALAAVTAGQPPLIAEISHYDNRYVQAKAIVSLNNFLSGKVGGHPLPVVNLYPPVRSNGDVGGQHYRLQADLKVSEFFYNKALFAKAGVSVPTTWNGLAAILPKLAKLGVIPMAFKDSTAHILSAFRANGGHYYRPGGTTQTDFNSAAGIETFGFFRNLDSQKLMILAHGSQIRSDFGAGRLAIADGTSAGYQKILAAAGGHFQVGAFAFPAGSSGHSANMAQGLGFVIFNGRTPAQQQAAWTWVQWFMQPQQQAYWAMHSGFAPETAAAAAEIPSTWLKANPGEAVSIQEVASPYTAPRPNSSAYQEVQSAVDSAFFDVVTGKKPMHATLAALDATDHGYLSGKTKL